MKIKLIAFLCVIGWSALAQFGPTLTTKFPYTNSLNPGSVFVVGNPGSTNLNLAASNSLQAITSVAGGQWDGSKATNVNVTTPVLTNNLSGLLLTNNDYTSIAVGWPAISSYTTTAFADENVGFTFLPKTNMVITELGRWIVSGNVQVHTLSIYRTNDQMLLATVQIDPRRFTTNEFGYVKLPQPLFLPRYGPYGFQYGYKISSSEYISGDNYADTVVGFTTDARVQFLFGANRGSPIGFSGWPDRGYPVNFKFSEISDHELNGKPARKVFASDVQANMFHGSGGALAATHAAIDYNNIYGTSLPQAGPVIGIDDWVTTYFPSGTLPNERDLLGWAITMRTNGTLDCISEILIDDWWDYVRVPTNSYLAATNYAQYTYWGIDGYEGCRTNRARSNGHLLENPVMFPRGLTALISDIHTNGATFRAYLPYRTNMVEFAADIDYLTKCGADAVMIDMTVGGEGFSADKTLVLERQQQIWRTFQYATLKAGEDGNSRSWTNSQRGMRLHSGGVLYQDDFVDVTNQMMSAESLTTINSYIVSGEDTQSVLSMFLKVKKTAEFLSLWRPWHHPDIMFFNYVSGGVIPASNHMSKLNLTCAAAASWLQPSGVLTMTGSDRLFVTNKEFYAIARDRWSRPAHWVKTNDLAEVGVRAIGEKGLTNFVVFANMATTNITLTLNVTNFGGVSNVTYYARSPWFFTNTTFVNVFTNVAFVSNVQAFVIWPATESTNYHRTVELDFSGTGISKQDIDAPTAAPHYFQDSLQQSAANASTFKFGILVEPEIEQVRVTYQWVSGLTSGTVFWTDTWTTYYNSPVGRDGGVNYTTNIFCVNNAITETTITIPMPATNAWKQLNFSAAASTNINTRILPFGLKVVKVKP